MRNKKAIKPITAFVVDYISQRIVKERYGKTDLNHQIVYTLYKYRKEIERLSKEIYNDRDLLNSKSVNKILDIYLRKMLSEIDKVDLEKVTDKDLPEIFGGIPGPIAIIKMGGLLSNINKIDNKTGIEQKEFEPIIEYKREILNCYRELAEDLDFTDSLELAHFYSYLLWNGYFSPTGLHTYQLRDRIVNYPTLEVFQGKGVCANYAALLKDYMYVCGKEAAAVSCYVDASHMHPDESITSGIDKKDDITNSEMIGYNALLLIFKPIIKKLLSDHAITLICDNNQAYYYDPTNLLVLNPEGATKAKIVNGKGVFNINLALSNIPVELKTLRNIEIEMLLQNKTFNPYEKEEVDRIFNEVLEKAKHKEYLINSAYRDIKPSIIKINEEINNHKDEMRLVLSKKKIKEA